ncbi:MAG TPA: 50S ribosomal protein L6 [Polyangiaceae bacterium]|jgi:large subunit ribosomal protein L6
MATAATAELTQVRQSRIGKRVVPVPKGVTVTFHGKRVDVQGPKGKLEVELPDLVSARQDGAVIRVESSAPSRDAPRLQGLGRALLANVVRGTAEGYERILELVGTGYRCEVKGKVVTLLLGYSHPCVVELPASVSGLVPPDSKGTQLVLSSPDKGALGQIAASIRALRPPEPYAGKGVRYRGEVIRRKAGKAGKAKAK